MARLLVFDFMCDNRIRSAMIAGERCLR